MTANNDDWGRDPAVIMMRQVFKAMEAAQSAFLKHTGISPLDPRLGTWRQPARSLFEKTWLEARRRGIDVTAETAAVIFVHCLANRIMRDGYEVSDDALPDDPEIEKVVREVMP